MTTKTLYRCITIYAPVLLFLLGLGYLQRNYFYEQAVSSRPLFSLAPVLPSPAADTEVIYGQPAELAIPRLGLDLKILNGSYDATTKGWTLDDWHAFWMVDTPQLTDRSKMTIIYGHDQENVFGHLNLLKPGDALVITTAQGALVNLRYRADAVVQPTDVQLARSGDATVALITCSGSFYQQRRVMYFDFVSAVGPKVKSQP